MFPQQPAGLSKPPASWRKSLGYVEKGSDQGCCSAPACSKPSR